MPRSKSHCPRRVLCKTMLLLFTAALAGCGRDGANTPSPNPSIAEDTRGLTLTVSEDFPPDMPREGIAYAVELKNTGAAPISIREPAGGNMVSRIWQEGTDLLVSTSDPADFGPSKPPAVAIEDEALIKTLQPGRSFKLWTGAPLAPGMYRVEYTYYSRAEPGVTWTGKCKSNTFRFTQVAAPAAVSPEPPSGPAYSPDVAAPFDPKAAIEGLASRNSRPGIFRRGGGFVSLFSRDFDWSDQDRVLRTVAQIEANAADAWPELAKHFDDHRYALTYRTELITMDGVHEVTPIDATVGYLCRAIVQSCLVAGFIDLLPPNAKRGGEDYYRMMSPGGARDNATLRAWCDERQDKRLYEIQLEMCSWANANLPLVADLSAVEKQTAIARIEQRAREIVEAKTASLPKIGVGQKLECLNEAQAEAIRVKYPQEYELFETARHNGGQPPLIAPPPAIEAPTASVPTGTAHPSVYVPPSKYPPAPTVAQPPGNQRPSVYRPAPTHQSAPPTLQTEAPKIP